MKSDFFPKTKGLPQNTLIDCGTRLIPVDDVSICWSWLTTTSLFTKLRQFLAEICSRAAVTITINPSIMPRSHAYLPLSSADHHHHLYSKSGKTKKSLQLQPLSQHRTSLLVVVASLLCFLIGIAGITFSVVAFLRPRPIPIFRCGRTQDTFRAFYSLPSSRRLVGRDSSAGTGTVTDRPKFLGFVGIQTGFSSADRREALRSAWFPSEPEGLLRYI